MSIIFTIVSIVIFIRTISYGLFEIKKNSNTFGGIVIILIALTGLIYPNIVMWINGIY